MAKGIVYGLIGLLAFLTALGMGGKTTGTKGMLFSLSSLPSGEALLFLIGIGLVGYSVWNLVKAIKDPEKKGHSAKGILIRTGYFITAIIYSSIAFTALKFALHARNLGMTEKDISAKMLAEPLGQWLVGLVGAIILGYGLSEIFNGIKKKFMKKFNVDQMNEKEKDVAVKSGKAGLVSRGIVLSMVGYFFIQTAISANPKHTKGIGGALSVLAHKPYGHQLLALIGLGLILYGVYSIIRGRYETMEFGGK